MTDQDRGAYTPQTDAPLAFDARHPTGRGGAPTTLIVSGVVLALLVGAVALFYRGGVRAPNAPPPVVGEPVGAMKSAPPAAAQPPAPRTQPDVYNAGRPAPASPPVFAQGPEQPLPRPTPQPTLRVQTGELPPAGEASGPPPAPPPPKPAPVAAQPKPAPAAAQPKITPLPTPAAASGPALVQIGAFKSEDLASAEWGKVAMDFPADMAGKGRRVEPVATGGATLYRGQITGFASREAAAAFCAKLKGAGRGCLVR